MVSLVHFLLGNLLIVASLGTIVVIIPIMGIMIVNDPDSFGGPKDKEK